MFEWYFKSIIVYMIIMCCASMICADKAKKNGWLEEVDIVGPSYGGFLNLFCISAVPIVRLLTVLIMFVAAIYTKEQVEEWAKKLEEDDELVDYDDCEVHDDNDDNN